MPRKLTDRECRKIERWARANKKSALLDFLAELPRHVVIPRPILFGSWQGHDRFIWGYSNTALLIHEIWFLDDEYRPIPLADTLTLYLNKNHDHTPSSRGQLKRAIHLGLGTKPGKVCLASHLSGCSSTIVAAHSIQRSELARFARSDNHVYGYVLGGPSDHRNFGVPDLVGLNVVTTFTGVCSHHDNEIFKPIETKPFCGTRGEAFLYHYRALLFGHYLRSHLFEKLERIHEELPPRPGDPVAKDLIYTLRANDIDRREVAAAKEECDRIHISRDHSQVLLAAWTADCPPPIVGTLVLAPLKDFHGTRLQAPEGNLPLDWVTLTIAPKDGRSLVVIGANSANRSATRLINSFEALPVGDRMQALLTYGLCFIDLLAILPHFWENLDARGQEAVIRTVHARYYPRKMPRLVNAELKTVALA
jgi:hypothetical protein